MQQGSSLGFSLVRKPLACAICFDTLAAASILPCGHTFCKNCAAEFLTRQRKCAVCNAPCQEAQLIPNFTVQAVVEALSEAEARAREERTSHLVAAAGMNDAAAAAAAAASSAGDGGASAEASSAFLSPVERVFVEHAKRGFLAYQSYYSALESHNLAQRRALKKRLSEATEDGERERLLKQLDAAQQQFSQTSAAIADDYARHIGALAPPLPLLPASVTIIVAAKNNRSFDMLLQPFDTPPRVYDRVCAAYAALGDEVLSFSPATALIAASDASAANGTAVPNDSAVFSRFPGGRPPAGAVLRVEGELSLLSERPKPCFAVAFTQREDGGEAAAAAAPQRAVDYYACVSCGVKWVCDACARACHEAKGHEVRPFQMQHRPTWACCYCAKRAKTSPGSCSLADAGRSLAASAAAAPIVAAAASNGAAGAAALAGVASAAFAAGSLTATVPRGGVWGRGAGINTE